MLRWSSAPGVTEGQSVSVLSGTQSLLEPGVWGTQEQEGGWGLRTFIVTLQLAAGPENGSQRPVSLPSFPIMELISLAFRGEN